MSYPNGQQRSLFNVNTQSSSNQSGIIGQLVQLLSNVTLIKTLRNTIISGSTIDDTVIGNVTPNQARFTSLNVGIANTNQTTTFYGPNNSQLVWHNGLLEFVNAGIGTKTLYLDALAKLVWGDAKDQNAYILNNQKNSLAFSDPIPSLGDSITSGQTAMGFTMRNHHFFGLCRASTRSTRLSGDAWSFQVLPSETYDISLDKQIVLADSPSTMRQTALEIAWCFPEQLRQSYELIVMDDDTTSSTVLLDVKKHTSKLYGLRTTAVTSYSVTMPSGDDDGHIKCIQYLPQTSITETQVMTDPSLLSAKTLPQLVISGRFCLPPFGVLQSNLVLNGFGLNVLLQYDTVTQAWTVLCNGNY